MGSIEDNEKFHILGGDGAEYNEPLTTTTPTPPPPSGDQQEDLESDVLDIALNPPEQDVTAAAMSESSSSSGLPANLQEIFDRAKDPDNLVFDYNNGRQITGTGTPLDGIYYDGLTLSDRLEVFKYLLQNPITPVGDPEQHFNDGYARLQQFAAENGVSVDDVVIEIGDYHDNKGGFHDATAMVPQATTMNTILRASFYIRGENAHPMTPPPVPTPEPPPAPVPEPPPAPAPVPEPEPVPEPAPVLPSELIAENGKINFWNAVKEPNFDLYFAILLTYYDHQDSPEIWGDYANTLGFQNDPSFNVQEYYSEDGDNPLPFDEARAYIDGKKEPFTRLRFLNHDEGFITKLKNGEDLPPLYNESAMINGNPTPELPIIDDSDEENLKINISSAVVNVPNFDQYVALMLIVAGKEDDPESWDGYLDGTSFSNSTYFSLEQYYANDGDNPLPFDLAHEYINQKQGNVTSHGLFYNNEAFIEKLINGEALPPLMSLLEN